MARLRITNRYYRIIVIVWTAAQYFARIWLFQRRARRGKLSDPPADWDRLLIRIAEDYKAFALRLQGVTIKFGQFLSVRADVLPQGFIDTLKSLVDQVPPTRAADSMQLLQEEWGNVPSEALAELSPAPVASASIADVYKGRLKDGRLVAIKVQRPHIRKIIMADIRALRIVVFFIKRLTRWGEMTDLDSLTTEFETIITGELDFRQELASALKFKANLQEFPGLAVPEYMKEWTTSRVLVSEWIEGEPVVNLTFLQQHGIAPAEVAARLAGTFVRQIAKHGFFHADPHPGNLLIRADGVLYFIDFGMTGTIPRGASGHMIRLVQAVIVRDYRTAVDALYGLRFVKDARHRATLERMLETTLELYLSRAWQGIDLDTMDELMEEFRVFVHEQPLQLPAEYAFLGRAISLVSGLLAQLDPELDVLEAVKPHVQDLLIEERAADGSAQGTEHGTAQGTAQGTEQGASGSGRASDQAARPSGGAAADSGDPSAAGAGAQTAFPWRLVLEPLVDSLRSGLRLPTVLVKLAEQQLAWQEQRLASQKQERRQEQLRARMAFAERRQRRWLLATGIIWLAAAGLYGLTQSPLAFWAALPSLVTAGIALALERTLSALDREHRLD